MIPVLQDGHSIDHITYKKSQDKSFIQEILFQIWDFSSWRYYPNYCIYISKNPIRTMLRTGYNFHEIYVIQV